ncbi:MAG: VOC family protein [Candidatus Poribacteria bacterium]|nr:VOC family protein [Candidatus Poribacteria bacterium]
MGSPVVHFEIGGENVEELIDFYTSVFEWSIFPLNDQLHIADPGSDKGIQGHLFQTTEETGAANLVIIYVQVDDIHAALKHVESLGGKILIEPQAIPGNASFFAIFQDPSGNRIGLLQ